MPEINERDESNPTDVYNGGYRRYLMNYVRRQEEALATKQLKVERAITELEHAKRRLAEATALACDTEQTEARFTRETDSAFNELVADTDG